MEAFAQPHATGKGPSLSRAPAASAGPRVKPIAPPHATGAPAASAGPPAQWHENENRPRTYAGRDGRFLKRSRRWIWCDGCGECFSGEDKGDFWTSECRHLRETREEKCLTGEVDPRWFCIRCYGQYWQEDDLNKVKAHLGFGGRAEKRSDFKKRKGTQQ